MKYTAPSEFSGSSLAGLQRLIVAAGGHIWTPEAIKAYMQVEAKKLQPNWLYYFALCIPLPGAQFKTRLNAVILLGFGASCLSALYFLGCAMFELVRHGECIASGSLSIISAIAALLIFLIALQTWTIRCPGSWKTVKLGNHNRYLALPVIEQVKLLECLLADARLEISLLYQDEILFDPVIWIVHEVDGETVRTPFIVWDGHGKVVLPQ